MYPFGRADPVPRLEEDDEDDDDEEEDNNDELLARNEAESMLALLPDADRTGGLAILPTLPKCSAIVAAAAIEAASVSATPDNDPIVVVDEATEGYDGVDKAEEMRELPSDDCRSEFREEDWALKAAPPATPRMRVPTAPPPLFPAPSTAPSAPSAPSAAAAAAAAAAGLSAPPPPGASETDDGALPPPASFNKGDDGEGVAPTAPPVSFYYSVCTFLGGSSRQPRFCDRVPQHTRFAPLDTNSP